MSGWEMPSLQQEIFRLGPGKAGAHHCGPSATPLLASSCPSAVRAEARKGPPAFRTDGTCGCKFPMLIHTLLHASLIKAFKATPLGAADGKTHALPSGLLSHRTHRENWLFWKQQGLGTSAVWSFLHWGLILEKPLGSTSPNSAFIQRKSMKAGVLTAQLIWGLPHSYGM